MRILSAIIGLLLASPAAALPGLVWGEGVAALQARFGDSARRLDPPLAYGGGLSAPLLLDGQRIGGVPVVALLQLDGQGLRQVLFRPDPALRSAAGFARLLAGLRAEHGPEARFCALAGGGAEAVWRLPDGILHAVFTASAPQVTADPPAITRVPVPAIPDRPRLREVPVAPPRPPDRIGRDFPDRPRLGDPPPLSPIPQPDFAPPAILQPRPVPMQPAARPPADPILRGTVVVRLHDPGAGALSSPRCPLPRPLP
jgi:hypothetical protein